jgi:hypothetical protein
MTPHIGDGNNRVITSILMSLRPMHQLLIYIRFLGLKID